MIKVSFDNLDEVMEAYDPKLVRRANRLAIKDITKQVQTRVSKSIREVYPIKAGRVKKDTHSRIVNTRDRPTGIIEYSGKRISLATFFGGTPTRRNQPVVKTSRGKRLGARGRIVKGQKLRTVKRAFWGQKKGSGSWQVFQRVGQGRYPIRRLTGPSVAHMARTSKAEQAVPEFMNREADRILRGKLDFVLKRKAGIG